MPLSKGSSKTAVSSNIGELTKALGRHGGKGGKPESHIEAHKRAVAAALRMADKAKGAQVKR